MTDWRFLNKGFHIEYLVLGITESEYSIFFYICYILIQVTAVSFNDTSDQILSGGIDNEIKVMIPANNY